MKNKLFILLLVSYLSLPYAFCSNTDYCCPSGYSRSKHLHKEAEYQHAWCAAHNGIEEYKNSDNTRVDCLTENHAVEFDFAYKWAESVGQALHYHIMTKKKGMVVLILECPLKEMIYYERVKNLGLKYNFDTDYITPKFLE